MTPFKVVIPARLGSTRLPRKVLRPLAGKPLLQWVWEAARASAAEQVIVAADDAQVLEACAAFGADARLTAATHQSGTDRINEIAQAAGWSDDTLLVNLQGDEPLMPPALILQAAQLLAGDPAADIATLCHPLYAREDWLNPNVVKLVMDAQGYALYFSRAPVPWRREPAAVPPTGAPLPPGGEGGTSRGAAGGGGGGWWGEGKRLEYHRRAFSSRPGDAPHRPLRLPGWCPAPLQRAAASAA